MSERLGKKFAEDFEQIDDVKPTDKILIQDSEDGVVKYAIPQQVNSKFEKLVADIAVAEQSAQTATDKAQDAAHSAEVAQSAKSDAVRAMIDAQTAEEGAQQAVNDAVAGYASEVQELKQEAEAATANANGKAEYAKEQGDYAKEQGDYAKAQGNYAKAQGNYAGQQGERAEQSANNADASVQRAGIIFERANNDHQTALNDHAQAVADNTRANTDHTRANADHNTAVSDHQTAVNDHTTATSQQSQFEQAQVQRTNIFNASQQERQEAFTASQQAKQEVFTASETARQEVFDSKEQARDEAMATIDQEAERLDDLNRDFGKYASLVDVVLTNVQAGKRYNANGELVTDAYWSVGKLGAVVVGNTYELKMESSAKMVLGTALFVAHTTETAGTTTREVYTPLFSAMSTDIPASGYVCFEAMEAYDDVLVSFRNDVTGANTLKVRRYGTKASIATQINNLKKNVDLKSFADGYYQGMRVGDADHLTPDGVATTEEIKLRVAGGTQSVQSGSALIKAVRGNTVVYNQHINMNEVYRTLYNVEIHVKGGRITLNGTATGTESIEVPINYTCDTTHNYLFGNIDAVENVGLLMFPANSYISGNSSLVNALQKIFKPSKAFTYLSIRVFEGVTYNNVTLNIRLTDLTQMFTAGNEPTTLVEFEARCPKVTDPYAYNAGTIVGMTADGIATKDEEGNPVSQRKWSNILKTYFGGVMHGWNNVRDEFTGTRARKVYAAVDMSTLSFSEVSNKIYCIDRNSLSTQLPLAKSRGVAFCARYTTKQRASYSVNSFPDKEMVVWCEGDFYQTFCIRDNNYTSVSSFRNSLQGVMLYYELATPKEYTYDELAMIYAVTAGGTEEMVTEGDSMPVIADIVYPLNELAAIRANTANIGILANLATASKSDLVNAINELAQRVSTLETRTNEA